MIELKKRRARFARYIEVGRTEGKLEIGLAASHNIERHSAEPFVGPHVFSRASSRTIRLANEEIFGPVLSVIKVRELR